LQSGTPTDAHKSCNQSTSQGQFYLVGTPRAIHRTALILASHWWEWPDGKDDTKLDGSS